MLHIAICDDDKTTVENHKNIAEKIKPYLTNVRIILGKMQVLLLLLEWFYFIRNWKIESDLWNHPRKYVVPVIMLLTVGAVQIFLTLI